jgi:transcription elongation factor Elf1
MSKKSSTPTVGYNCPRCGSAEHDTVTHWIATIIQSGTIRCQQCGQDIEAAKTLYVPMQPEPMPS